MKILIFIFSILSIIFLNACSTRGDKVYAHQTIKFQDFSDKTKILYSEYEKWKGVPYKLGGVSLSGVDCSSFIQQVCYDAFGLKLPRTTINQLKIGHKIDKRELQVGDIIFFKTDWNARHVGIIIQNGKFLHASTSSGVTVSSIYNPYWVDKYYQSRRILP